MKKTIFCLFAAVAVILSSCGGNKSAIEKILKTVPKSSQGVFVADLPGINDKLKSDGHENIQQLLLNNLGSKMDPEAKSLLNEDSPIDFESPAVGFEFNNQLVFSFYVTSQDAMKDYMKSKRNKTFSEQNGVLVCSDGFTYMKDNQVWTANRLSASEVKTFANLSKDKSFLANAASSKLLEDDSDVAVCLSIGGLGYDSETAQAVAALNLFFDDPTYAVGSLNFEKGKVVGSFDVLNSKGQIATCAVHPAEINVSALKSFPGRGDMFVALGINSELMQQITSKIQNMGIPANVLSALDAIDGNVVMSLDLSSVLAYQMSSYNYYSEDMQSPSMPQFMVQIPFKSAENAQSIQNMLNMMGASGPDIAVIGNALTISSGVPNGAQISEVADDFKGACAGVAIVTQYISNPQVKLVSQLIKGADIMWKNSSKGLSIDFTIDTKEGENSLATFVKLSALGYNM